MQLFKRCFQIYSFLYELHKKKTQNSQDLLCGSFNFMNKKNNSTLHKYATFNK